MKIINSDVVKPRSINNNYTYLQGEHLGAEFRIDKIITNNKTNSNHIITVVYNGTSATTEDDILSLLSFKGRAFNSSFEEDLEDLFCFSASVLWKVST